MLQILTGVCKTKGKDVIIVRPKVKTNKQASLDETGMKIRSYAGMSSLDETGMESRHNTWSCKDREPATSGCHLSRVPGSEGAPQLSRSSGSEVGSQGLLAIPASNHDSEGQKEMQACHSDGKPRVIGSPKLKPRLKHLHHAEGNVSIEVPSPTEMLFNPAHMMRSDSCSDDNLSLIQIQSPDSPGTGRNDNGQFHFLSVANPHPPPTCIWRTKREFNHGDD